MAVHRRPLFIAAAATLVVTFGALAAIILGDPDSEGDPVRRAEPDAETLREATLAGPSGPKSEALRSGLSSMRCNVAYRAGATTEERTVEIALAYGGGGEMLHFDDATVQIAYQDLEAYPPELFIGAATRPGGVDFTGQPAGPPRIHPDALSPGDVVRSATLHHPSSGSTLSYSCSVE